MNYIEIAGIYLNLNHVSFIRKEEHSQLGTALAIHLDTPNADPLYIGAQHYDELRALLINNKTAQQA